MTEETERLSRELARFLERSADGTGPTASVVIDVAWAIGTIVMLLSATHGGDVATFRRLFTARWATLSPEAQTEVRRLVAPPRPTRPSMAKASIRRRDKRAS